LHNWDALRNTREENQTIKQGEVPAEWLSKPHKLAQKDVAARWTKKSGMSYYGYKNHVNSDVGFKFIRRYTVTAWLTDKTSELAAKQGV
jgi:IS5 family transposase